jgi:CO/xanthine dehydrogenase FAD-binding subunit
VLSEHDAGATTAGMPAPQGSQARRLKASVLALAELRLESEAGARTLKAEDFFVDIMTTAARPDEILTQVSLRLRPASPFRDKNLVCLQSGLVE